MPASWRAIFASGTPHRPCAPVHAWFYAALSRLLTRIPGCCCEEHGRFYPEVNNGRAHLVNQVADRRLTHRFVAVSRGRAASARRYEGLDTRQIEVIYNGVAADQRRSVAERASLRASARASRRRISSSGRSDASIPSRTCRCSSTALAAASEQNAAVRRSAGRRRAAFDAGRNAAARAGLANIGRLTGYRTDAAHSCECMDLFVLSSFSEGTSMALLEAMAAGCAGRRDARSVAIPRSSSASRNGLGRAVGDRCRSSPRVAGGGANPGLRERVAQHGPKKIRGAVLARTDARRVCGSYCGAAGA